VRELADGIGQDRDRASFLLGRFAVAVRRLHSVHKQRRDTQCPNRTCAYFCAATASLSFPNLAGDAVCNNPKSYFPLWFF
jgi:hypothetical protein